MALDPEQLAALLQEELDNQRGRADQAEKDLEALRSEFAKCDTREAAMDTARQFIEDTLPEAVHTIKHLIGNAESESVRAGLSKYVVNTVLERKLEDDPNNNGLKKLLEGLADKSKTEA